MSYTAASSGDAPPLDRSPGVAETGPRRRPWSRSWWTERRDGGPAWERPALAGLLVAAAVAYLVGLGASGWANSFYSAAVQAGSVSWKAFLFGSSDAGNSITVDKPPASLWVMALSVRIFGLSSWSILVPQALVGVATIGVLYAAVRRHFSAAAALLSGVVLLLTPVAALMFRFNNPDALLVLLMTLAAYTVLRALEHGRTRWLVAAGALIGLGFLTKQLQVFLVVPALAVTYLAFGPPRVGRRVVQLLAAGAALLVTAGWWVALVELWPAASRPYIGGSTDNSFLGLTLGYNGLGRLTGEETGSVGGGFGGGAGGAGGSMWGETGITRLFTAEFGGQIAWLIPGALLMAVVALVLLRRQPRGDGQRAQVVLWLSWLLVTGLTFSFMSGIIHAYYSVALAPAVAALVGVTVSLLWSRRSQPLALGALAVATATTAVWSFVLLSRSADFVPWLSWVVLVAGLVAAVGLVATAVRPSLTKAAAGVALAASLAGPLAYTVQTVSTAHTGSIVSAGPTVAGAVGGPVGMGRPGGFGGAQADGAGRAFGGAAATGGTAEMGGPGGMAGGMGGLLNGSTPSAELVALLEADASSYRWVAATVGANNAAGYQLATQESVMPIGGFNGTDASPTLEQFQAWVTEGKIHYFIPGRTGGEGQGTAAAITAWVEANFTAQTVGSTTVYDLTAGS
ncbi:4-amino-4-deoxy-L-arabinose transferase [Quadrisphaera granulorum]|uniref:4-amino-4-deoxy-L-arabinose transferase-like glycosyltransferase n=2 Tax=Quadrisphaera granulorum TaxID=317664 RepID=A0A316A9J6_9ACTN|nr:4-amino-4-deoxy-L-arabinose transferase-like glycosyltransferase [Quadrisphaera granulorum]SZE96085.1 4-amino-4-deoxy-L-arabinose transferase [Quadrisphaera granulorum]